MNPTIDSLLADLGMPEGHTPPKKKIVPINHDADKVYSTPGQLYNQLRAYEKEIVSDPLQVRNYVTNKLLEISGCGDVKHELKALELLGKITNVGLFSEHSQVTITHANSQDLEAAIKDKIKKLLDESAIDVTPEEEENEENEENEESGQSPRLEETVDALGAEENQEKQEEPQE